MQNCRECKYYKLSDIKHNYYPIPDTEVYSCELYECVQDNPNSKIKWGEMNALRQNAFAEMIAFPGSLIN